MRLDDLSAAIHGSLCPFPGLRRRSWLERLPLSFELPQGRGVQDVVNSVTVPFERCAQGVDGALFLRNTLLLGAQRIALLLDDLVDALVLAAQLPKQLFQFRGVLHGLRRELSYAAGGAFHDQPRGLTRLLQLQQFALGGGCARGFLVVRIRRRGHRLRRCRIGSRSVGLPGGWGRRRRAKQTRQRCEPHKKALLRRSVKTATHGCNRKTSTNVNNSKTSTHLQRRFDTLNYQGAGL